MHDFKFLVIAPTSTPITSPNGSISPLSTEQGPDRPITASAATTSTVTPQPGTEAGADGTGQLVRGVGIGVAVGGVALVLLIIIFVVIKVMKRKSSSTTAQGTAAGGTSRGDFEHSTTNIAYNWQGGSGGYGVQRVEHEYDYPNEVIEAAPNHIGT